MKKKLVGVLLCATMILTACGSSNESNVSNTALESSESAVATESTATKESAETTAETSEEQSGSVKIEPLESQINVNNLADGTYSVSFTAADSSMEDGTFSIHVTVYDYEHFDAAQVNALKEGNVLSIDGNDMTVESVSVSDTGLVTINGGLEEGGCDLYVDEDGTYYESLMDIGKNYVEIGEVTLPVSEEFIFTDDSNPEKQGVEYYAGDMITYLENSEEIFSESATKITVADGKIVSMHRIYLP